jgi:sugar phosphate permease
VAASSKKMRPEETNRVTANSDSLGPSVLQVTTMRRVALRIVPFLMVCYFVSFLDRVNVGFAALQMVKDLHMSPAVFGFGSGVFFVSYFLCEVPSNLILQKVGARLWIARIMITWGVLAGGMALVTGPPRSM